MINFHKTGLVNTISIWPENPSQHDDQPNQVFEITLTQDYDQSQTV